MLHLSIRRSLNHSWNYALTVWIVEKRKKNSLAIYFVKSMYLLCIVCNLLETPLIWFTEFLWRKFVIAKFCIFHTVSLRWNILRFLWWNHFLAARTSSLLWWDNWWVWNWYRDEEAATENFTDGHFFRQFSRLHSVTILEFAFIIFNKNSA